MRINISPAVKRVIVSRPFPDIYRMLVQTPLSDEEKNISNLLGKSIVFNKDPLAVFVLLAPQTAQA